MRRLCSLMLCIQYKIIYAKPYTFSEISNDMEISVCHLVHHYS
uniref:Uncharacterized protein n=1 Tax=Anguilla anguilla TaxID=7936 RepID=A0A0E9V0F4_ANGAN